MNSEISVWCHEFVEWMINEVNKWSGLPSQERLWLEQPTCGWLKDWMNELAAAMINYVTDWLDLLLVCFWFIAEIQCAKTLFRQLNPNQHQANQYKVKLIKIITFHSWKHNGYGKYIDRSCIKRFYSHVRIYCYNIWNNTL